MYRILSITNKSKIYTKLKQALVNQGSNANYAKITVFKKTHRERDPCPQPPPAQPPPPKDDSLLWGTLAVTAITSAFIVYAKNNPEVRDWLSIYAPWFDEFISALYEENMTHKQYAVKMYCQIKDYFEKSLEPTRKCTGDEKIVVPVILEETISEKTDTVCATSPPPTKAEFTRCIIDGGQLSLHSFMTVRDACKYYNEIAAEKLEQFTMRDIKFMHHAINERKDLIDDHLNNALEARAKLFEITNCLDINLDATQTDEHRKLIQDFLKKIAIVEAQYKREVDMCEAWDRLYVEKLEPVLLKYTGENDTILVGVDYESKRPMMPFGNPDLLLIHQLKYLKMLKAQLDDASSAMSDRIDRDLQAFSRGKKLDSERDANIKNKYAQKLAELKRSQQQALNDIKPTLNRQLKSDMDKQAKFFKDITPLRLADKEKETQAKLDKLVADKIADEKLKMHAILEQLRPKLTIMEQKLNARLKAERETKRSQQLWTAGASLLRATRRGDEVVDVKKEIRAIERARGGGDKLVETVLKSIPESVKKEGIVPESVIRSRFDEMESCAKAVALVEHDGASMSVYILSWMQSMMLFMKVHTIPQKEIDEPPKEPFDGMDTFDLLRRARYYLYIGNLAQAVIYVDALKGASRIAAKSWYDAAHGLLVTKQAAEAIIAHATALGLQYL